MRSESPVLLSKPYTVFPINSFPEFWHAPQVCKGPVDNCEIFLLPTSQQQLCTMKRNFDSGHAILNSVSERKLVIPLQHPEPADLILLHFAWLHFTSTAFLTNWRSLQCFSEQSTGSIFPITFAYLVSLFHILLILIFETLHKQKITICWKLRS